MNPNHPLSNSRCWQESKPKRQRKRHAAIGRNAAPVSARDDTATTAAATTA